MANGPKESTRRGKRRSKRLKLAAIALSQRDEEGIRISERDFNPSPDQNSTAQRVSSPPSSAQGMASPPPSLTYEVPNHEPIEEEEILKKRKRGKTKLRSLSLTPTDQVEVEFNERGQPIGMHSRRLSSYLGVLVRERVPVTCDDWRKVDNKVKNDLWICVKTRFKIDDKLKKLCIQMMGTRWREFKSRLITSLREASQCPDKESVYASLKPDSISSLQEWNNFVAKKLSDEFEVKSKRFKHIREKNVTPHTMSRKGYARLEDEMKKDNPHKLIRRDEVWQKAHTKKNGQLPTPFVANCVSKIKEFNSSRTSSQNMLPIYEDALSHALGPERNGRVRGMGFGVVPSQVGVHVNNFKKLHVLENELSEMKKGMQKMENLLVQYIASKGNGIGNTSSPQLIENMNGKTPSPCSENGSSMGSTGLFARNERPNRDVGRKCKLLNWQKAAVAEATIASMNPNDVVHFVPLGKDDWKVWVDVPLVPKAPLWRPNSGLLVIEDAVGSTIAWNKDFIALD